MIEAIGDAGFVMAATGLGTFSVLFLVSVRWWSDWLGRSITSVIATAGVIAIVAALVLLGVDVPEIRVVRAILYPLFGLATWLATGIFIWAQFIAPRRRLRSTHQTSTEGDAQ